MSLIKKYQGTALIVGSAPCLYQDLNVAKKHSPDASIFALNGAAAAVQADFLVSVHPEAMNVFRQHSQNKRIVTLSGQLKSDKTDLYDVDFWFADCNSGATSAGSAIKIAIAMGFNDIILCGCPLNGGDGYADECAEVAALPEHQRLGRMGKNHQVHQNHLTNLKYESSKYPDYVTVRSMGGKSAEVLGYPEFMEAAA